ncbi:MAG: DUF4249 domain-containing protein [Saprospiraceae bacterium]
MKNLIYFYAISFTAFLFSCGGLEKEIDLELPLYESQLVVECYLEPGEPFTLLLTKSAAYFDPIPTEDFEFVEKILEDSAVVTIQHKGVTYELPNQIYFNQQTKKLYNYYSSERVPNDLENDFTLKIIAKDGREVTAKTRILPVVPIDSVVVEFNPERDSLARVLTYVSEDPNTNNYYRRMLHVGSLDTIPDQDFTTNDDFVDDGLIIFGSGYDFKEGDIVFNSIFHIDRAYFDFMESVFFAMDANGNPFGQPAAIKSNVEGDAIGIFTGLSVDRVATEVKK